jgi:hypothetical protein
MKTDSLPTGPSMDRFNAVMDKVRGKAYAALLPSLLIFPSESL